MGRALPLVIPASHSVCNPADLGSRWAALGVTGDAAVLAVFAVVVARSRAVRSTASAPVRRPRPPCPSCPPPQSRNATPATSRDPRHRSPVIQSSELVPGDAGGDAAAPTSNRFPFESMSRLAALDGCDGAQTEMCHEVEACPQGRDGDVLTALISTSRFEKSARSPWPSRPPKMWSRAASIWGGRCELDGSAGPLRRAHGARQVQAQAWA